ncbi:hypothetical protein SC206_05350 [Rouxiella sp. T17]|uniref:hypothetical protein n=1 Tax=Rouxiella sp. T17 TaxID=3085684 RepID=UPI002FCAB060
MKNIATLRFDASPNPVPAGGVQPLSFSVVIDLSVIDPAVIKKNSIAKAPH